MEEPTNIGNQIRDAVQSAISSQDFSKLRNTVEQSLGAAADGIGRGIAQAQENARIAREKYAIEQELKAQREAQAEMVRQQRGAIEARYLRVGGQKASGACMVALGGMFTFAFGTTDIAAIFRVLEAPSGVGIAMLVALSAFLALSVAMLDAGIRRFGRAKRFQGYRRIIGDRIYCSVSELADRTGKSMSYVVKDLTKMIAKGWFKQGRLDRTQSCLILTDDAYRQFCSAQRDIERREHEARLAERAEQTIAAGGPVSRDPQAILEQGRAYIAKIRASNSAIPGAEVSAKIDRIELVVNNIFERACEHPEVIPDLERLMDYYLPVTIKLLDAYEDLDSQPVQSEAILESKREIESTLDALNVAFEKLLDSVFKEMTWDVSTDISVLRTVLAQEGLVENPFDATQNRQA